MWVSPPECLVIFYNRLVYRSGISAKQHIPTDVQPIVEIQQYRFRILGTIDHHGCNTKSGHYTLLCLDNSFHCNDQVIIKATVSNKGYSSIVHMMFYVLTD